MGNLSNSEWNIKKGRDRKRAGGDESDEKEGETKAEKDKG